MKYRKLIIPSLLSSSTLVTGWLILHLFLLSTTSTTMMLMINRISSSSSSNIVAVNAFVVVPSITRPSNQRHNKEKQQIIRNLLLNDDSSNSYNNNNNNNNPRAFQLTKSMQYKKSASKVVTAKTTPSFSSFLSSKSSSCTTSSSSTALSLVATSSNNSRSQDKYDNDKSSSSTTSSSSTNKIPFWKVLWKFTRPHTIIGSALAIPSLHLLAATSMNHAITNPLFYYSMIYAMIPSLLMNLYITGLNQITDVEIDKTNKPYLPIAAGILKPKTAIIIVIVSLLISLWMGTGCVGLFCSSTLNHNNPLSMYATPGLNVALWGSGILGTLYSLEPIRLKKHPIMAAFCIVAVRGTIINASFFAHAKAVLAAAAATTTAGTAAATSSTLSLLSSPVSSVLQCLLNDPVCWYSSLFFGFFGLVIALMKDVPDVVGDKIANIRTFSVRLGQEKIFKFMNWLLQGLFGICSIKFLQLAYIAAAAPAATTTTTASSAAMTILGSPTNNAILILFRLITAISAATAMMSVRKEAKYVNPTNSKEVYNYYMHLWKLFYLSYFVMPMAR